MSGRRITGRLDFEALRRAIERGDPDSMLEFYADDAGARVLNGGVVSFEVEGKAEVAKYLRAVHARPAIHRVDNEVLTEERIRFEESCEYPDGARTVVETRLEIREGEISRQEDVVVGRAGRSEVSEQHADRGRDRPAPSGASFRDALDPKVRELLDLKADAPPIGTVPVGEMRAAAPAQMAELFRMGMISTPVAAVEDRFIPGPAADLPVRVYTPEGHDPFPVVVFFHGGGWVLGSLDTHDPFCRALCAGAGCVVVSVGYRLAPEHRFPAASDDALAATFWVAEHAAGIGADPARIALAGDSAGGNLSAVTAVRIRDDGGPALRGQLLIYPAVGYHTPPTPSYIENAEGYGMTREAAIWFWGQYLADESQATHPHAAPLLAPDLGGLPPALVITAEYDVLRDEGERYAERLRVAGVPARLSRYDGVHHRFAELIGILDQAANARDEMCAWLREVLAESGPSNAPPGEGTAITRSTSDGLVRREGCEKAGEEVGM
jgi:acetyl esterase